MKKLSEANFIQYVSEFDGVCFVETFLEHKTVLDCFPDFNQYCSPSTKFTQQGRSSGGVMIMVKRALEPHVRPLDRSRIIFYG